MRKRFQIFVLLFLGFIGILGLRVFVFVPVLFADEINPINDEDRLRNADRIVLAKVIRSVARKDQAGNIRTYIDFKVEKLIKGKIDSSFMVAIFGGQIGEERVQSGVFVPEFAPQEELLLLLGADNDEGYPLIDSSMWFYRTVRDQYKGWIATDVPAIPLFKAGTDQDLFLVDPEAPGGSYHDGVTQGLKDTLSGVKDSAFLNTKFQDFSKSVTVGDLIWSVEKVLK